jgi:small subunit ribosomal protein S6
MVHGLLLSVCAGRDKKGTGNAGHAKRGPAAVRTRTGQHCRWLLVSWPGCDEAAYTTARSSSCHGNTVTARVRRRQVNPMRQYEMMIILDPSLEERTVQPSLDQFLKVVTTAGGTVDKVDVWGRRRLAYEIDHKSEGIYTVIELKAEPDTVKELDRQLNLNEAVLRTKILRPDLA